MIRVTVGSVLYLSDDRGVNGHELWTLQASFTSIEKVFSNTLDISTLPRGIYLIRLFTPLGISCQRFIKE